MSELIKLSANTIGGEEIQTVNGRDLHAFLGIKKDYSNWAKAQIDRAGFVENVDYVKTQDLSSPKKASTKSRSQVCINYHFTLSASKEISMMSNTPKGKEARLYFIECEKVAKAKTAAPMIPQTLSEALRLAADLEDKRLALENQVKEAAPKVAFADQVTASREHMTITETAKMLGYPPRKMKDYLREIGWLYAAKDTPMESEIRAGRLVLRMAHFERDGLQDSKAYCHVTTKGAFALYKRMLAEGLIKRNAQLELAS